MNKRVFIWSQNGWTSQNYIVCDFHNNLIYSIGFCAKDHQDADKSSEMCHIERALGDKTSKSWPLNTFQFERSGSKCTGDVAHGHVLRMSFCIRPKEPKITIEIVGFLIGCNSQRWQRLPFIHTILGTLRGLVRLGLLFFILFAVVALISL